MKIEWYNDSIWYSQKQWGIKPHRVTINWNGIEPKCAVCDKKIRFDEMAFYCLTDPVRLRGYGCAHKICLQCGYSLMDTYKNPKTLSVCRRKLRRNCEV